MAKLRNTNPLGDVYFPLLGRDLTAGEEFEVDDETAGVAPFWRKPAKGEDTTLLHTRGEGSDLEVYDLGSGLLAQTGNFEAVTETKKKGA